MELTLSEKQLYNAQRNSKAVPMPCWAPLKSLYFGFRGNVSVCCFNKTHVVGKYPDQSIREIWFGPKVQEIKEALKEGDFSLGCHGCHELIKAGNYNGLPAKNFDQLDLSAEGYPTKMDFELSNECNLECVMCRGEFSSAIRKNREKLPPIHSVYDEQFIDQLEEFIPHLQHSHFLGGEPFMIPLYLDIWERMIKINPSIRVSVQTNGTILTDRVKNILNRIPMEIGVSIDSIEEENYERIRKNGSFKKVMENISYFRNYCHKKGTQFYISYCPMVQNWEELPQVIATANEWDCLVFFNTVFYPSECSLSQRSSEELGQIIQILSSHNLPEDTLNQQKNRESYTQVINQVKHWKEAALSREEFVKRVGVTEGWDSFCYGLKVYLEEKDELPSDQAGKVYQSIMEKLNYVLEAARKSGLEASAMNKIARVNYEEIYQSVPNADKDHMLYLFKSFLMPLPEGNED